MKFRGHETFAIRKGWLHKGMKHVTNNPRVFVDKDINQMDELGIGANMVKALRYWLQVVGLTTEGRGNNRNQEFTDFGNIVWENDKFIEEDGTLCLLHYKLISNDDDMATAWRYFFNVFAMNEFTKDDFIDGIKHFIETEGNGENVADRSLEDDFDCIIKTYITASVLNPKKDNPENNIDSPLGELGLIRVSDKKAKLFRKDSPRKDAINPLIILAIILSEKEKNDDGNELKISRLLNDPNNVGRIFNLDTVIISYHLDKLQQLGLIRVIRTAGLDVIRIDTGMSFIQCVERYYQDINR